MTAVLTLVSNSAEETRRLGERLGALLRAGDVVLLSGELGAGKTVFVQGIARGLGYEGPVSSKSFVLLGEYAGRVTLYHADLYRLEAPEQVAELALEEISGDGVLVVEWPERAGEGVLPEEQLRVQFEVTGEESREVRVSGEGKRGRSLRIRSDIELVRSIGTRPPLEERIGYRPGPAVLATLPPRERQAIELRFGLVDGRIRTLAEVGSVLGVTRERARQLVQVGLHRLRHRSRRNINA